MTKVTFNIATSLDGFVAGPNASLEEPLGEGGEALHDWAFATKAWREPHGEPGGEDNPSSRILADTFEATGAVIVGRRMFSSGEGPWESDPKADSWWGEEPPFHVPVFVLTHHARESVEKKGGTTFHFVTDGIESALERARAAAGDRNVAIGGGAQTIQQYLRAGLVDEFRLDVAPLLLGGGVSLFGELGGDAPQVVVEQTRAVEGPAATHVFYRVVK
jgi:dihydrofolate reductase